MTVKEFLAISKSIDKEMFIDIYMQLRENSPTYGSVCEFHINQINSIDLNLLNLEVVMYHIATHYRPSLILYCEKRQSAQELFKEAGFTKRHESIKSPIIYLEYDDDDTIISFDVLNETVFIGDGGSAVEIDVRTLKAINEQLRELRGGYQ